MTPNPPPNQLEFEQAVTDQVLRTSRMIHLALMIGPVIFAAVVLGISSLEGTMIPDPSDLDLMLLLTLVHTGFAAVAFAAGLILFRWMFSPGYLQHNEGTLPGATASQRCVHLLRLATLIRMALLEGAALFGITVCMVGAGNGALHAEPSYWLNLGSTALLIMVGGMTFPTKERLNEVFQHYFGIT